MFGGLAEEIENLEIPLDGDALCAVLALRSRLDEAIAAAVGEFDHAGMWSLDHANSMTAWLRTQAGLTTRSAARLSHTGRRLRQLPGLADAWRTGTLTAGQVDAILANVSDRTVERFAQQHHELVAALAPLSVTETITAMRYWRAHAEADLEPEPAAEPDRSLFSSRSLDGRRDLWGHLDTEGGDVVATALDIAEHATDRGATDRARVASARRADALVEVCRFFLDHHQHPPASRHRPHLNLIIDTRVGQACTIDGVPVPNHTAERLACDSLLHRVHTNGSVILDFGRAVRTAPPALWNALVLRDRHCRFPGCDAPPAFCQGHHTPAWDDGGTTSIDTMALMCTHHHTLVHQPGWHCKLLPDGELHLIAPNGTIHTSRPPGPHLQAVVRPVGVRS